MGSSDVEFDIWLNEKSEHDLAHVPNEEEEYSAQFFYYGHFHNNVIFTYFHVLLP